MNIFKDNEPTQLQKDRMRIETRYLTVVIAIIHALYVLNLISNHTGPIVHKDFGSTLLFLILVLVNIHLYDESKCYHYCFWHRQPIIFSLYYEISRILWDMEIIQWSSTTWNTVDGIILGLLFSTWFIGYSIPYYLNSKRESKESSI